MKRILLSVCSIFLWILSSAFHIVGGEIEFITIEPGLYRINLIQYFDEAQDENEQADGSVTVHIYSNKDDSFVADYSLPFVSQEEVLYTNPKCSRAELQTSKITYSLDVELDPREYTDSEGYYIVWERCCRNSSIVNIVNPEGTGMEYIVEIPPLWKDGEPFINSSPELLKPLSDYACINQLYYAEFTGSDRDGDSLVYRLATPLNSHFGPVPNPAAPPSPKPNVPVTFAEGYSVSNAIPGNPPLRISNRGLLTVSPSATGLYVFSVIVEEWRNKERIGYVQRDFQMLAISEGCNPPDPPKVAVKIPGDEDFDTEVDVLRYELADDKCFEFVVTNLSAGETISFRAEPVNFDEEIEGMFSFEQRDVGADNDTIVVQVCAPGCPPIRNGPFIIDLIASDNACPLPQLDTVRLRIEVQPPPNSFPVTTPLGANYTVNENDLLILNMTATDDDDDVIVPELFLQDGGDPEDVGMFLNVQEDEAGFLDIEFVWDTNCQQFDFTAQQNFQLGIRMEDQDTCEVENPNITWLSLEVLLPLNTDPEVTIDSDNSVSVLPGQTIAFNVSVFDADQDTVNLFLRTVGFAAEDVGVRFDRVSGEGEASSIFTWTIDCDQLNIDEKNDFTFLFIADDDDACRKENFDTLAFKVHVEVPKNHSPRFKRYPKMVIEVNQPFVLDITANDPNEGDSLRLEFFDAVRRPESPSLSFEPAVGRGTVTSVLEWTPECNLLDFGQTSAFFDLAFLVYDNACIEEAFDTLNIIFEVRQTRSKFDRFEPPNVFTPNDDGKNDVYTLTNLSTSRYNLPPDNCDDSFQYISIHDRSGKPVFETNDREFVWDGKNVASGTYFYLIKYSLTEYKGYLQVLR